MFYAQINWRWMLGSSRDVENNGWNGRKMVQSNDRPSTLLNFRQMWQYRSRTLLLQFNARTKTRRRPDELSPTSTLHHIICFFFCSWFESTNGQNRKSRVRMWRKFIYMLISGPLNLCTPASAIHQRVDGFHATHARRFYRFVIRLFGV